MKPVFVSVEDYEKDNEHVYAYCHCTCFFPNGTNIIRLKKQPGKIRYEFCCEDCGVTGEVISLETDGTRITSEELK